MTNCEKQRKLLLLGANRSNVLSIRSAREAGFFVVAADPHPGAPGLEEADIPLLIDVGDCDRLLAVVREMGGVSGIVSMSEVGVRPAARMCAQLGLPSISEAAATNARSKAAMRRLWARSGFSVEFVEVESEREALKAVDRLGLPLIFKPDRTFGGSRGVSRVESRQQVPDAFHFATRHGLDGSSVVIERCVDGTEHSCEALIYEGTSSVLCIGQKVKSPAPYRVDLSVQYPALLSHQQEEIIAQMCQTAVSTLGLTRGAAHVEFANTANGPILFELGARCGGGHTPQIARHVSGVDEFIELCRMACGDPPNQFYPSVRFGADYRFLIFPPGRIADIQIPEEVRRHPRVIDIAVLFKVGDEIRALHTTSERAGFVVTLGRERRDAVELADWACRQITIRYADGSVSHGFHLDGSAATNPEDVIAKQVRCREISPS